MDDYTRRELFGPLGDVDPLPPSLLTLAPAPEQAKTLALLQEISRDFSPNTSHTVLLRTIAERIKRLVNYDVFSVMIWNEEAQLLRTIFAVRYEESIPPRLSLRLHEGLTGSAAGQRATLRVNDVLKDPRYIRSETGIDARSELVVPLLRQDRLVGVLDFESALPHAFTAEHERMLTTLAPFLAVALENSRLYEEARESQLRLQNDLDTARDIQMQLLPTGAREVPGLDLAAAYTPARDLGGDFYDFLPYGEGKLAMALGDVSGKGTAAALYGALAIGILREHVVVHNCPPAEMLATLNDRLQGGRLEARFIAMLFAVYDAPTRRLTLANAGCPYPLLLRNGQVTELRLEGVPLGLFPGTEYEQEVFDLLPGDVLVFASDGIVESDNSREEEFGAERLARVLAESAPADNARVIADRIFAATEAHSGPGWAPHDDRTLLVLRVTDEPTTDFFRLPIIY
ncbi:MAG: GAF domain-containing SpoIIE family protein phosphatase [Candidatus Acidiferrum sp.]|jgi:sigma-B regulation protein RsbU (phosphoserine phosphatase)